MKLSIKSARLLATLVLLAVAATEAEPAQITAVAHNGSDVLGPGTALRKFRVPVISDAPAARIVLRSAVDDPSAPESRHSLLALTAAGAGEIVASRGDVGGGSTFRNFLQPSINDDGDFAWYAFLSNGERGIFRTTGGNPANRSTVVQSGNGSSEPGYTYTEFDTPEIVAGGRVVFWAEAESLSDRIEGVFSCEGGDGDCTASGTGTLTTLIKSGDLVPPGALRACSLSPTVSVSTYGVAFRADLKTDCGIPGPGAEAIVRVQFAGLVVRIIRSAGDSTGDTGVFSRFRDVPDVANDGTVVFRADTTDLDSNEAIFLCDPTAACPGTNPPQRIVTKGDNGFGTTLAKFSASQMTNNGDVVFLARPRGPSVSGTTIFIWRSASSTLEVIATGYQLVNDPNLPPDTRLRRPGSIYVSPGGDVVFRSTVRGVSIDWRTGIFLWEE